MITDKDNIIYSLGKSIEELEKVIITCIENNNKNDKDIYNNLGTTLFWIGSCLDRLRANGEIDDEYEKAFRGAYNAQKHSISLVSFQYYKRGGISFPLKFSLKIPSSNYYFKKLEENVIKSDSQIKSYNKILSNKPIIPEIKKIQRIIVEKFNNY